MPNTVYYNQGGGDEQLTPDIGVKIILPHIEHHKGKIIWCPFDQANSAFVRVLREVGHTVMLGDVVDYCEQHGLEGDIEKLYGMEYMPIGKINLPTNIFTLWEEKRKPITEQSDECVKFIYSLISE